MMNETKMITNELTADTNSTSSENTIQIPACDLCACCADCIYMDTNDRNSWGDCFCGYHRKYYPASDRACGHFRES